MPDGVGRVVDRSSPSRGGRFLLVLGDALAILVFSALGRASHSLKLDAAGVVLTGLPFLLAWLAAAVAIGAYRLPVGSPAAAARQAALTWLAAAPLAFGLRSLLFGRGTPLSFAGVAFVTNLVLLTGWRAVFAWLRARRAGAAG